MDTDYVFMRMALDFAKEGMELGNLPVGAVLVLNGEYTDKTHNAINSNRNSHAESNLIGRNADKIHDCTKEGGKVELYSSWEPCLMCFSTCILNRVGRIVYSCPDPRGGATGLKPELVGTGYRKIWPEVHYDERLREESCGILLAYMESKRPTWDTMIEALEEMRRNW